MINIIFKNQKIMEKVIIVFFLIPSILFAIFGSIFFSEPSYIHTYLIKEKVKRKEIDVGCLYYHHTYKKYGDIGYYFKINGILIKDLNLTMNDFPFSQKENQFLIEFHLNTKKSTQICYPVKYVYSDFLFKKHIFVYDSI